jgi:Family of unknown function (DUF5994)
MTSPRSWPPWPQVSPANRTDRTSRHALPAWDTAPRRIELDGFRVRLEGFTYQDRNLIHITGANRDRISLLMIPPETTATTGHNALTTAGHPDNTDAPPDILVAAALPAPRRPTARKAT